MDPISELRVHGVSGTPPREMLHTDPVPRLDGDPYARIFRRRPSLEASHPSGRPYEIEAFHWGSLTTGHWLTSLWIFLAPFALANVAGWMASHRSPLRRSAVRVAGLALTGLFVAQMGYVLVEVPVLYAVQNGWDDGSISILAAGGSLAWVLAFGAIVLRLSTQSHFAPLGYRQRFALLFSPRIGSMAAPGPNDADLWADPAAAPLQDPSLWSVHPIVHRLRRIHFAAGQLVVMLALSRIIGSTTLAWGAAAALAISVLLLVATTLAPKSKAVLTTTAWSALTAEIAVIAVVPVMAFSSESFDFAALHETTFQVAIALGLAAGLSAFGGIAGVGALTIATFLGGAFGVGAGLIAEDALSVGPNLVERGGAWVLPASLIFVLFLGLAAVAVALRAPPDLDSRSLTNRILTRVTGRARLILGAAALFGLIVGAAGIIQSCALPGTSCRPGDLDAFRGGDGLVLALIVVIPVLLAGLLFVYRPVVAGVLIVAAAVVLWIGLADPAFGEFKPRDYLEALPLARTIIFVGPLLAIGRSVMGAYRQGAASRKVGVLWDIASFWPRWFHPLGPPAYGPKVVTELKGHVTRGEVEVLAAHSQGSMIAAVAVDQAVREGGGLPRLLITYGSPIGRLYGKLFPDVGISDMTRDVPGRLERGWVNLRRIDDPIGGEALGGSVTDVLDTRGSGHSGYELGVAYRDARDTID